MLEHFANCKFGEQDAGGTITVGYWRGEQHSKTHAVRTISKALGYVFIDVDLVFT